MFAPLLVLCFAFIVNLIEKIGHGPAGEKIKKFYQTLSRDNRAQRAQDLKLEILDLKREIAQTSAQDEFVKYAKLRRQLDAATKEYEEVKSSQAPSMIGSMIMNFGLRALLSIVQGILMLWYRKTPMFFIPKDWVGPLFTRLLALPFAPTGSVSVAAWFFVCRLIAGKILKGFEDYA